MIIRFMQYLLKNRKQEEIHRKVATFVKSNCSQFAGDWITNNLLISYAG